MDAAEALRLIRSATEWLYTSHAISRMRQRGVHRLDLQCAVASASRCEPSDTNPNAWLVTGPDRSGEVLKVSIVIEVKLVGEVRNVVVTVM